MRLIRTLLSLLFLVATSASASDLTIERVFGPEIKTGPYKHPACLTELANGDLYLVYYGGEGEYATDTAVYGSRKKKGEATWSAPAPIAHDPIRSVGNGVIWQSPDGLVWLFYVVREGETWSTSRVQFKVSRDGATTWSDASVLSNLAGTMVRGLPIVLADGSYLLPAYRETGHDTESVGSDSTSIFFRFDPNAKVKRWVESAPIRSKNGNIQPAVVELKPGHLIAYCRRGGDYSPKTHGFIVQAASKDSGRTWSEGVDSAFPNPNAAVDLLKLKSGEILLVYNDCFVGRSPLTVTLSGDLGKTFSNKRNLVDGPGDFGYPVIFQGRSGELHLVYTSERRAVVNHAVFTETWVTEK